MPKATPKPHRGSSLHSVQPAARRRTPWRLARSAVIVLGVGVVIGAVVLTFFPKQQTAQALECIFCTPHSPEPGPGRSWEVNIPISTYSQVNTRHGNVFTAIPIVGWSGRGPDMSMMLYHNSANVDSGYRI